VGAVLVVIALLLGVVGTIVIWAYATQRDGDGFFTSDTGRLETLTHAIVSDDIDLGTLPGADDRGFDLGDLATVRIAVDPQTE